MRACQLHVKAQAVCRTAFVAAYFPANLQPASTPTGKVLRQSGGPLASAVILAAGTLESELRNAANEMNSRRQQELPCSYEPHLDAPYYYVVVSPGVVTAQDLRTLGLSPDAVEIFPGCMSSAQPFVAVMSRERAECLQPITDPKIVTTLVVRKARGVATEVRLRQSNAGAEVSALK